MFACFGYSPITLPLFTLSFIALWCDFAGARFWLEHFVQLPELVTWRPCVPAPSGTGILPGVASGGLHAAHVQNTNKEGRDRESDKNRINIMKLWQQQQQNQIRQRGHILGSALSISIVHLYLWGRPWIPVAFECASEDMRAWMLHLLPPVYYFHIKQSACLKPTMPTALQRRQLHNIYPATLNQIYCWKQSHWSRLQEKNDVLGQNRGRTFFDTIAEHPQQE